MASSVICLLGTSRCGSTLVQDALARQSGALALGEIVRVHALLERQADCACGAKLASCAFWAPALGPLRDTAPLVAWSKTSWLGRGKTARNVLAAVSGLRFVATPAERNSARSLADALARLAEATGGQIFIDSSKELAEFLRLALLPSGLVIPVHVLRDPRGVAWSAFRRTGTDPIVMARHWANLNRAISWLMRLTAGYPWQVVRYEDFCADPSSVGRRLLAAAGHKEHSTHSGSAAHAMGGSPGFSSAHDPIVVDERWKLEMPEELQHRIMGSIGRVAQKFGYS